MGTAGDNIAPLRVHTVTAPAYVIASHYKLGGAAARADSSATHLACQRNTKLLICLRQTQLTRAASHCCQR